MTSPFPPRQNLFSYCCHTRRRSTPTKTRRPDSPFRAKEAIQPHALRVNHKAPSSSENKGWVQNRRNPGGSPIKIDQDQKKLRLSQKRSENFLQLRQIVDAIRALPASKTKRIECLKNDGVAKDLLFSNLSGFNDLLMASLLAGDPELALNLFDSASSFELVPDSWTYSIIIRCHCMKNDPGEGKRVLEFMLENGWRPNVATFTMLVHSFCRRGRLEKAFEVLGVMGRAKCEPAVQTFNCLIKGLCYVGRVEEGLKFLADMKKSSQKPDIYTYTAVMDGLCKVGRSDEAMELLNEAVAEMELTPSAVTFNTLFQGFCKEGRPLKGISLLKQMKACHCQPDYISYCTLLRGLLKWGEVRAALQIYKEMAEGGFEVDKRMLNTLLRDMCRRSWKEDGLFKDASQLFDRMKFGDSDIYPQTYDVVIQTLCIREDLSKALFDLHEVVRIGYTPRTLTFSFVIQALCANKTINDALKVLVLMHEAGRIPSKSSYNLIIDELNQQGRLQGACTVYGTAIKQGIVPKRKPEALPTVTMFQQKILV